MLTEHRFQLTGAERGMPTRVWGHVRESVSNMAGEDGRRIRENGKGEILISFCYPPLLLLLPVFLPHFPF